MKAALLVLAILLAGLQFRLWTGSGSVPSVHKLQARISHTQNANDKLKARNQKLEKEVALLKHSKEAIESRARSELGMIKGNETFYLVLKR